VGLPEFARRLPTQATATAAAVCLLAAVPAARDLKRCSLEGRWRSASPVSAELRDLLSAGAPGPVLADSHALDDVLAVGRDPLLNDPYLVRLLIDNGGLKADAVVRALGDGSVPYVVLSHSLERHRTKPLAEFPRPVLDAVARHYHLAHQGERLYLYRFRE
jgi:hypothetical protein